MPVGPPSKIAYSGWSPRKSVEQGFSIKKAGAGIVCSLFLAILLSFLAAGTLYFTNLDERALSWVVNVGSFVVVGLASFVTAKRAQSHGLLYGAVIGVGYAVLTFVIGSLVFPPLMGISAFLKRLSFSVLAGASGGILGVNY